MTIVVLARWQTPCNEFTVLYSYLVTVILILIVFTVSILIGNERDVVYPKRIHVNRLVFLPVSAETTCDVYSRTDCHCLLRNHCSQPIYRVLGDYDVITHNVMTSRDVTSVSRENLVCRSFPPRGQLVFSAKLLNTLLLYRTHSFSSATPTPALILVVPNMNCPL